MHDSGRRGFAIFTSIYGTKWEEAIPLVQLISLGMAFDLPSWVVVSLLQSRGQFRLAFVWSVIFAPVYIASVFIGGFVGRSIGVAMADLLYYTFASPILVIWIFRTSDVTWAEVLDVYLRPVLVGVFAAGMALVVSRRAESIGIVPTLQFVAGLCVGLFAALIAARVAMPQTWQEIRDKLGNMFPRLTAWRT